MRTLPDPPDRVMVERWGNNEWGWTCYTASVDDHETALNGNGTWPDRSTAAEQAREANPNAVIVIAADVPAT